MLALQKSIEVRVAPLLVSSDIRIWVSANILTQVADSYNTQPNKDVQYTETGQEGQLVSTGAGGLDCGYSATLQGAKGLVSIPSVSAEYRGDATIGLTTSFQTDVRGKVIAHVNGPPGPCSVTHPVPSCDCQVGSGADATADVTLNSGGPLSAIAKLSTDSSSWLNMIWGNFRQPLSLLR